jgi:hypothetical protein
VRAACPGYSNRTMRLVTPAAAINLSALSALRSIVTDSRANAMIFIDNLAVVLAHTTWGRMST